jgi:two-component system, LuxR family, sensor kinase FixL
MSNRQPVPEKRTISPNEQNSLQRFAAFVRNNRINEFVAKEIELFLSLDLPLLKYISHLTEEERSEIVKRSGERFLLALEHNAYNELIVDNFSRWENNEIKFISKQHISLQDILLINSAQKLALFKFIPEFTRNPNEVVEIAADLEIIYHKAQLYTVIMLEKLRKEEEQKFHESEERYRDLFDNASDLIHIVTSEGKILYVNKAWKQTLGYTEEELEGESIYFFVCSKDREKFRQHRNKVLDGIADEEMIRISLMAKDNREIVAEGSVTVKWKDGKPEYTRGIFRDATRRVQNEEKLQFYTQQVLDREEKLKQLVQSAPDAIIVINEESIINIWNPKAEEIFGWKAEEVLGMNLSETIIPAQHREGHNAGMRRLLQTGEARVLNKTIEITALRKDGTEFYIALTISRANVPQGSLFIAFIRDISEKKQNEEVLEEQRVQLERTNSELEQYAWVASHDLKEPLRKIRTFSDMLLNMPGNDISEDAINKLKKIHESAERMDKLIEAILLYSHSSADQESEIVDLNQIVKEVISDLEVTINNKRAHIDVDELPTIKGIPFQLRQLFQNLISNALKYSKPGIEPDVHILCSKENNEYEIEVKDNGIGFNVEYANKIFQVFQRLVTKQEYEGTGIGLALCKKIVENHGGVIEGHSKEGEGSSFIIRLPV